MTTQRHLIGCAAAHAFVLILMAVGFPTCQSFFIPSARDLQPEVNISPTPLRFGIIVPKNGAFDAAPNISAASDLTLLKPNLG